MLILDAVHKTDRPKNTACKHYMEKRATVLFHLVFFSSFYLNTYLQLKYFWVPGVSTFLHSQLCNPWQSQIPHPPLAPQIQWTLWKASCPNCLDNVLWWISCPTRAVYQLYSKESWLGTEKQHDPHASIAILSIFWVRGCIENLLVYSL